MTRFELKSMQPPAAPQWQGEKTSGAMTMMVTVQPVGWIGDMARKSETAMDHAAVGPLVRRIDGWHARRDGRRGNSRSAAIRIAARADGRRGHRSGTVGDAPAVLMVIQFDDAPAPAPCAFAEWGSEARALQPDVGRAGAARQFLPTCA